jgi:hypothetical protein
MNSIPLSAIVFELGVAGHGRRRASGRNRRRDRRERETADRIGEVQSSHSGVGHYTITFTQAFPAPYATCIYMPLGNYHVSGLIEKTTSCDVTIVNSSGSPFNVLFNFLAVNTTN